MEMITAENRDAESEAKRLSVVIRRSLTGAALLWTYNFIPSRITRKDDVFDSQLTVMGKVVTTDTFYATPVSDRIAFPLCPIEYQSENGDYL